MTVSCVTVSVNRVSVLKTVSRCQSTGWRCRVGWSWGWDGGWGSLTNTVSYVTLSQGVSVLKTVSVNRVAMSVTMTLQCVMVSVNRVAMPGRMEGVCVCVWGGVSCVTVSVNKGSDDR